MEPPYLRGWWHTVEIVLFEISNSIKPYPFVFHAYTSRLRPVTFLIEPTNLDEVSNRISPTSIITPREGGLARDE